MTNESQNETRVASAESRENFLRLRATTPLSVYSQISEISLYFERVWEKNRVLSIEDCLSLVEEDVRLELFERLLEVDVSLGIEHDAAVSQDEYKKRFPEWTKSIDAVYDRLTRQSGIVNKMRVGRNIGNYRIEQVVGKGGMGVVYKAFDQPFNRTVAIKYLLPSQTGREECVDLFRREMEIMGQIPPDSPFAQAYNYARDGSFDYFVMEYVDGVDLAKRFKDARKKRLKNGEVDWREAATYVLKIAEGLETIHRLGIVHRDVKPENVMLDKEGRVRILDLGLGAFRRETVADERSENDGARRSVRIVGTLAYMAPESYRTPESVDARCDLYCLGGTFFYMLTGRPPIVWRNPAAEKTEISLADYLRREKIAVCSDVLTILTRLLEPDVDRRYQTASDVVRDLRELLQKYSPEQKKKRVRRIAVLLATALVAALAVLGREFQERAAAVGRLREAETALQNRRCDDALRTLSLTKVDKLSGENKRAFFALRGDALLEQARQTGDEEAYRNASNDFQQVLAFASDDVAALSGAARCAAALGDFDDAKSFAIRAVKVEPENVETRLLDGEISVLSLAPELTGSNAENARCAEALDVLDDAGGGAEACYWRARAYHWKNRDDLALAELNDAIRQNPEFDEARRDRANILFARANKSAKFESTRSVALTAAEDFGFVAPREKEPQARVSTLFKRAFCYFLADERDAFDAACDELSRETSENSRDANLTAIYAKIKAPFLALIKEGRCATERGRWLDCAENVEAALRNEKDEIVRLKMSPSDRKDLEKIRDFIKRVLRRFDDEDAKNWDELVEVWLDDSEIGGEIKIFFDDETPTNAESAQSDGAASEVDEFTEMSRADAERLFERLREKGASDKTENRADESAAGSLR